MTCVTTIPLFFGHPIASTCSAPTYNTQNVFNAAFDNKGIVVLPTSSAAPEDTISGAILFLYKWRTFYLFINKVMLKRKVDLKFTKASEEVYLQAHAFTVHFTKVIIS